MPEENVPESQKQIEAAGTISSDEKTWGMLCHLASLCYFIPFGNVVVPLIVWKMKREGMPFVDEQGKVVLNFQITLLIVALILAIPIFILWMIPLVNLLTMFFLWALGIGITILIIVAGIKASNGVHYRYPFSFNFIK